MGRIAALLLVTTMAGCVAAVDFDAFSRPTPPTPDAGAPVSDDDGGSKLTSFDAGVADATPSPPRLVQSANGESKGDVAVVDVKLAPVAEGDLLVLGIVDEQSADAPVQSITDDANDTFVSAALASDPATTNTDQIWYASAGSGVTHIEVTLAHAASFDVWAFDVSGASTLDVVAKHDSDGAQHASCAAPSVTPSVANAFVVSVASTSDSFDALQSGSPFTSLPFLDGNDTAWLITTTPGTYGAAWSQKNEGTNAAVTAAFR